LASHSKKPATVTGSFFCAAAARPGVPIAGGDGDEKLLIVGLLKNAHFVTSAKAPTLSNRALAHC
jgi:hypothetical protein